MEQKLFHTAIEERIDILGKAYEKIALATIQLQDEYYKFYEEQEKHTDRFGALNNHYLVLEKQPEITQQYLDNYMEKVNAIAAGLTRMKPEISVLVYQTKPHFDSILNFREFLLATMRTLSAYKHDKGKSNMLMKNLEEKFEPLNNDFKIINERFESVKKGMREVFKIYDTMIN